MGVPAAKYHIPIGATDRVTVEWEDWIDDLPSGQTLDTVTHAFDAGGDGGITLDHKTVVGTVSTHWLNASAATVGIYRLVLTGTSTAVLPIPDYVQPRVLTVQVVDRIFVQEDAS